MTVAKLTEINELSDRILALEKLIKECDTSLSIASIYSESPVYKIDRFSDAELHKAIVSLLKSELATLKTKFEKL